MFSLELPHRGHSNEHTQQFSILKKKENHSKLFEICSYGIFSKGLNNDLETAVVNEPSVFELYLKNGLPRSNQVCVYTQANLYMQLEHCCVNVDSMSA